MKSTVELCPNDYSIIYIPQFSFQMEILYELSIMRSLLKKTGDTVRPQTHLKVNLRMFTTYNPFCYKFIGIFYWNLTVLYVDALISWKFKTGCSFYSVIPFSSYPIMVSLSSSSAFWWSKDITYVYISIKYPISFIFISN